MRQYRIQLVSASSTGYGLSDATLREWNDVQRHLLRVHRSAAIIQTEPVSGSLAGKTMSCSGDGVNCNCESMLTR